MTTKLRRDFYVRQIFLICFLGAMALLLGSMGYKRRQLVLIAMGLAPLAFWIAISIWNYRRGPRELDEQAITRRDGKRFEWAGLVKIDRVHMRIHGQLGPLNHLKLRFRDGVVTIYPLTLEKPAEILQRVESVERRTRSSAAAVDTLVE